VGVDPRSFSLRRLKWLAYSRREHDFDVAINLTMFVKQAMYGRFDPRFANPYTPRYIPEDNRTEEQKKVDTKAGIQEIKMGLQMMVIRRE
jgi:hypothetical protein